MDIVRLETERLVLRRLELRDDRTIQELAGHPDVAATTLNIPHPYSETDAIDFINYSKRAMKTGEAYIFAVACKEDDQVVGCIGLTIRLEHQSAELGYWMGVPYWGRGYTTEAARRLLRFGFEELNLNRVYAAYFTHNVASGRVMEKIGMTYEGTLRHHFMRWGRFMDTNYYGILRSEYEAGK